MHLASLHFISILLHGINLFMDRIEATVHLRLDLLLLGCLVNAEDLEVRVTFVVMVWRQQILLLDLDWVDWVK
jgi:hypothetical protein